MAKSQGQHRLVIVRHADDPVAGHESVQWALEYLTEVCRGKGIEVTESRAPAEDAADAPKLWVAGPDHVPARELKSNGAALPAEAESFCLFWNRNAQDPALIAAGRDERGLLYALLEAADAVRHAADPMAELAGLRLLSEKPALAVRAVGRLFVSEAEDKAWFYNRTFWTEYLTELATHRINRLHLALGMGYDYGHDPLASDNYFSFSYPFLIQVPGYDVRVAGLPDEERERNLETLRFISREAKRRGIHFQLGLWNHAHDLGARQSKYRVEGVHPGNQTAYCRDAIRTLLQACPDIDGVTIRTHYEGGIPEPAEEFWSELFRGVQECGRKVQIDLHAKGVDFDRIDAAVATGQPVAVSPKYWAEHMGPPYHQAAIRATELPAESTDRPDLMAITATYRRFTRYGYGDFLRADRKFDVIYRIWPGTQRVLLWGDPAMAAGYGRLGSFGGALGIEWCEPLTFKGRKGSGTPGGRELHADPALREEEGHEWRKYKYSYRLWGRLLYNPDADPESWRRWLRAEFGEAARACEEALAHASRILLLLTAAHNPSAANNAFWPEMYTNMSIVKPPRPSPYDFDTVEPKTFGAVQPLDPALFYRIDDFVRDALRGERSGKYTPLFVADRLEALAEAAERHLAEAAAKVGDPGSPAFRRWEADVAILAGLGRFFAEKLRAGVDYAWFEQTGDAEQLARGVEHYRKAKDSWVRLAERAEGVYREDITFGYARHMRGHWKDRLLEIEEDLAAMERQLEEARRAPAGTVSGEKRDAAVLLAGGFAKPEIRHEPVRTFRPGEPVRIAAVLPEDAAGVRVTLFYRHANQVEHYMRADMTGEGREVSAVIPGSYTSSPYPIVYFFEARDDRGNAWIVPGFDDQFANQPYYSIGSI